MRDFSVRPAFVDKNDIFGVNIFITEDGQMCSTHIEDDEWWRPRFTVPTSWLFDTREALKGVYAYLSGRVTWGEWGAEWKPEFLKHLGDKKVRKRVGHGSAYIILSERGGRSDPHVMVEFWAKGSDEPADVSSYYLADIDRLLNEICYMLEEKHG